MTELIVSLYETLIDKWKLTTSAKKKIEQALKQSLITNGHTDAYAFFEEVADRSKVTITHFPVAEQLLSPELFYEPVVIINKQGTEAYIFLAKGRKKLIVTHITQHGVTETKQPFNIETVKQACEKLGVQQMLMLSTRQPLYGQFLFDKEDADLANKPVRRFLRMLAPDTRDVGFVYLYAIFVGIIDLSLPLGIQAIINLIMSGMMSTSWMVLILFMLVGVMLTGLFAILQLSIIEFLQQRMFARAAFQFAHKIPKLKFESLRSEYLPELVNRFFDILTVQKGLSKILVDLSTSSLQIIFGLLLLSFYHPFFIAFGVSLIFLLFALFYFTAAAGLRTSLTESKYKYKVVYWLEEVAKNLISFKLSGNSDMVHQRTDDLVSGYLDARRSHFRILVIQLSGMVGFKMLVTAGLLLMGGLLVFKQEMNIGQFVAAEIVIILLLNAVEKMTRTMETIYDVLTAVEKIGQVTDLDEEREDGLPFRHITKESGIAIQTYDLSYSFADREVPVLRNINLDIKANERVCITGTNGSGKSTLINILSGLYTQYKGSLTYNGIPAGNIELSSLRAAIGDDLSTESIFSGTLMENITMAKRGVQYDRLVEVAEEIGLMQYVRTLPEGFNTMLTAEDKRFPPSLVHKIILARGIICKPKLLIVDTHQSGSTNDRVEKITDLITDREQAWSLIVVSNNAYTASKCDKVLVLDKGQIIDTGTMDELKDRGFAHLFVDQVNASL